jgi:hypothetical protein
MTPLSYGLVKDYSAGRHYLSPPLKSKRRQLFWHFYE